LVHNDLEGCGPSQPRFAVRRSQFGALLKF
jgi:hypothetical protein